MKRKLHPTTQFKKDLKRYMRQEEKMRKLQLILSFLEKGEEIPSEYYPHKLHYGFDGCMECHIMDDFLLIWIVGEVVELVRLGSHAEFFGK